MFDIPGWAWGVLGIVVLVVWLWPKGRNSERAEPYRGSNTGAGTVGGGGEHWVDYTAEEWRSKEDYDRLQWARRHVQEYDGLDTEVRTDDTYKQRFG